MQFHFFFFFMFLIPIVHVLTNTEYLYNASILFFPLLKYAYFTVCFVEILYM